MPTEEQELLQEGLRETQDEIFRDALADEPPAETEPAPAAAEAAPEGQPATEEPGPARDDKGRFAAKQEKPAEPAAAPTQAATAPAEKATGQDHRVPLRELLDEREKRQRYEAQTAQLERQIAQLSEQVRRATEKPAEKPDFYADPDAYLQQSIQPLRQQFDQQLGQVVEGFSKRMAVIEHGEEKVNSAFAELERQMQSGQSHEDYAKIMRSQHPFGELVSWHKRQETMSKIGGDLDGFLKKREEELLNDPAFMQKIAEKLRAQSSGGTAPQGGKPSPNVQLPPSLSRVTSAAPRTAGDDDMDVSDSGLFRHALS